MILAFFMENSVSGSFVVWVMKGSNKGVNKIDSVLKSTAWERTSQQGLARGPRLVAGLKSFSGRSAPGFFLGSLGSLLFLHIHSRLFLGFFFGLHFFAHFSSPVLDYALSTQTRPCMKRCNTGLVG
jgi:hypothetical protein